jgi:hypothetical protein
VIEAASGAFDSSDCRTIEMDLFRFGRKSVSWNPSVDADWIADLFLLVSFCYGLDGCIVEDFAELRCFFSTFRRWLALPAARNHYHLSF